MGWQIRKKKIKGSSGECNFKKKLENHSWGQVKSFLVPMQWQRWFCDQPFQLYTCTYNY